MSLLPVSAHHLIQDPNAGVDGQSIIGQLDCMNGVMMVVHDVVVPMISTVVDALYGAAVVKVVVEVLEPWRKRVLLFQDENIAVLMKINSDKNRR
ncbi:hypothetical protein M422DRAFT_31400 [Sphaerobolus stellatus SS14]|uniref:Uncharacterized protein n=1 Tax=Sphaerobolus stellatus (strain SS14) TaxID=990650 RepID=A0A0C9VVC1_SPHS4|nr:hypothetical protein M422DRAFT_31400 [Sphaerobolus stellatus SS14]